MRLDNLVDFFLEEKQKKAKPTTIRTYKAKLNRFVFFLNESHIYSDHELTFDAIDSYSSQIKAIKTKTRNGADNELWIVGTFLRWIHSKDTLSFSVNLALDLPKQQRHKKQKLCVETAEKLLQRATLNPLHNNRDRLILYLNLTEGLSPSVLSELSVLDTDVFDKEIHLKKKRQFLAIQTKTTKSLLLYLKSRSRYLPKTDFLFVNKKGYRMTQEAIRKVIRLALKGLR
jgi:site-specific recombinase XerD